MNNLKLISRNISDNPLRSWITALCTALVAGLIIFSYLLVNGSQESLTRVTQRLGADIAVIPAGNQIIVEEALLMGNPISVWMPRTVVNEVANIQGVEVVSPQLFLSTMRGASCCTVSDMFMVAYDPATDFTIRPWLKNNQAADLKLGEAIGGTYITYTEGRDDILVYGYEIDLVGSLESTGSGLDQSLFFTYDTAVDIARLSPMQAEAALVLSPDSISTALVRLSDGTDPYMVADEIESRVRGVSAIPAASLFRNQREHVESLRRNLGFFSGIAWVMSLVLIGFVSAAAVLGRRQELGVLRALGATQSRLMGLLFSESALLTLLGGISGIVLSAAGLILFKTLITQSFNLPLYIPSLPEFLLLSLGILLVVLASVFLALLLPILKVSREEAATILKE
ncbi:MAG TPA: ABC transporter permease [Anaerolineaceae bacterium]|nr:ABC transporter permease [Anaerolineaceae bacterium]